MISNKGIKNIDYYTKEFMKDDYYNKAGNKEEGIGEWNGEAYKSLKLDKTITPKNFWGVLSGKNPNTDEKLSKYVRKQPADLGQDFVINANKDFSLLVNVYEGHPLQTELLKVWNDAQVFARSEFEKRLTYRQGKDYKQVQGAFIGTWQHKTSREENEKIDPHLHSHNVIGNYALAQDGTYKAVDFKRLFEDKLLIASEVQVKIAQGVKALGFEIEESRTGWQLKCISDEVRKEFSGRAEKIKSKIPENATYEEKQKQANIKVKKTDYDLNALKKEWKQRFSNNGLTIKNLESTRSLKHKDLEITKDDIILKAMSLSKSSYFTNKQIELAIVQKSQVYKVDREKILSEIFTDKNLVNTGILDKKNEVKYYHKDHTYKDFQKFTDKSIQLNKRLNFLSLKNSFSKDISKSDVKSNDKYSNDKSPYKPSYKPSLNSNVSSNSNISENSSKALDTQEISSSIDDLEMELLTLPDGDPRREMLEQRIKHIRLQMLNQIEEKGKSSYRDNNQEQQQENTKEVEAQI
ncbi:MobF family relaxase [Methylotenera sp. 1P/1]|uniref:MobF family relaxase n=1 Tax=Methylotenera sp. 1P/1 TaxID=1131551 RepID=UPI00035D07C2|nr:MobF family relaxase [Methylotenera sp. 1P/1]